MACTFASDNRRPGHLVMITAFLRVAYASLRGIRYHRSPMHEGTWGGRGCHILFLKLFILLYCGAYILITPLYQTAYRVDTLSIERNFLASRYSVWNSQSLLYTPSH